MRTAFYFLFALTFVSFSCSKEKGSGNGNGPNISSITPSNALTGDKITIKGKNLSSSTVHINGIASDVKDNTSTSITTSVPSGAIFGMVEVLVKNSSGKAKSELYITGAGAGPVIIAITPPEVAVGETITIKGTGLANAAVEVYKKSATITANTATSISVTVPSGIPTGQAAVGVTTELGYIVSSVIIKKVEY